MIEDRYDTLISGALKASSWGYIRRMKNSFVHVCVCIRIRVRSLKALVDWLGTGSIKLSVLP